MTNQELYVMLEEIRQKPAGWHGTEEANQLINSLMKQIPYLEWYELKIAQQQITYRGGSAHFYDIVTKLINKYRNFEQNPLVKTLL